MHEHLSGFNDAQKEAILATEGPLLVLAGAGAGKTRVITYRILELVRRGVAPQEILAITFTNKAAGEMRQRARALLNTDDHPFISTFHSLGLTVIKENYRLFGFKRFPVIYDRADSTRAMKEALKASGVGEEIEPRAALSAVSRQKGEGVTASEYAESVSNHRERLIAAAWLKYEAALREDAALDFDDLLARAERFLRENEKAHEAYQHRWRYIHIDEYQDTNKIQARMAKLLIGPERNICAVGDIDQTIYGWRGAEIANMLSFEKQFPGGKLVVLEQNYRSTKNILAAANDIIVKNNNRLEKNLFTNNVDGERLTLYQAYDENDEAGFIAKKIQETIKETPGVRAKDFAILYRANFQSRAIEEQLLHAHIPYQVIGTRFFERKEVKDALSLIRGALFDTAPDIGRIANIPARGIGKVTLLKMLSGQEASLSGAVREKVRNFRILLLKIKQAAQTFVPQELVRFSITESGMEKMYKEDKMEGAERLENLRELIALASRYTSIEEFLEQAALASDQDEIKDNADAVKLMTIHASKGLEFPYVFITGLEEGLFPYERQDETDADKEEERRLMYVALTRAQKKVFLTYASYRTIFGSKSGTLPSTFLSDISGELLELENPERLGKTIYLD